MLCGRYSAEEEIFALRFSVFNQVYGGFASRSLRLIDRLTEHKAGRALLMGAAKGSRCGNEHAR